MSACSAQLAGSCQSLSAQTSTMYIVYIHIHLNGKYYCVIGDTNLGSLVHSSNKAGGTEYSH